MKAAVIHYNRESPEVLIFKKRSSRFVYQDSVSLSLTRGAPPEAARLLEGLHAIILALPLDMLRFRLLEMPFSDKDKVREVIPFEMQGITIKPVSSYVFDCVVQETVGQRSRVLAVYIEKEALGLILSWLQHIRLDPEAVSSLHLRASLPGLSVESLLEPLPLTQEELISLCEEELKAPVINLRKGSLAFRQSVGEAKGPLLTALFLVLVILIALAGYAAIKIHGLNKAIAVYQASMSASFKEAFKGSTKVSDPLYLLRAKIKELNREEEFYARLSPLDLLQDITAMKGGSAVVYEVEYTTSRAILKGEAPDMAGIEKAKEGLLKRFEVVEILETKASAEGKVSFSAAVDKARERTSPVAPKPAPSGEK